MCGRKISPTWTVIRLYFCPKLHEGFGYGASLGCGAATAAAAAAWCTSNAVLGGCLSSPSATWPCLKHQTLLRSSRVPFFSSGDRQSGRRYDEEWRLRLRRGRTSRSQSSVCLTIKQYFGKPVTNYPHRILEVPLEPPLKYRFSNRTMNWSACPNSYCHEVAQ
jgi:hypothetical protein